MLPGRRWAAASSSSSSCALGLRGSGHSRRGRIWDEIKPGEPLHQGFRLALLERKGNLGFYLAFCEDYENANWSRVTARTAKLGLNEDKVSHLYLAATTWVNEQLLAMEATD